MNEPYDEVAWMNKIHAEAMKFSDSIDDKINNYKFIYFRLEIPNELLSDQDWSDISNQIKEFAIKTINNNKINVEFQPIY